MATVNKPRVVKLIKGDLNGITVTDAALKLANTRAVRSVLTDPITFVDTPYNADHFLRYKLTELRDEDLADLRQCTQIFLGAVGDPTKIPPGVLEVGILLKIRQAFDQYVNLRPVILPAGVNSPIVGKGPEDINFEICRENSEGLYANEGEVKNRGTDDEVGIQVMRCTYRGVRRLMDFAIDRALNRKERRPDRKPRVHTVFKSNILVHAAAPWVRVFEESKASRGTEIDFRYLHIDNFMMQMLTNPSQFDVVLTENMFGDIATDLGAVIQGGIGSAVSGNINPTGAFPSMFEPIHGTAPDKWYETGPQGELIPCTFNPDKVQLIKPEAAFFSFAMMLEQMGEHRAANLMRNAALANLRDAGYNGMTLDALVGQACRNVEVAAAKT